MNNIVSVIIALSVSFQMLGIDRRVNEYVDKLSAIGENENNYDFLYNAYNDYSSKAFSMTTSYSEKNQALAGMAEMYPYLLQGALYFTERNNNGKALKFAEAYLDISLNDDLKAFNLSRNANYPTVAYFAATYNYNSRNYERAIRYLSAYISSGETKYVQTAFNYIGKAYINLDMKEQAVQVLNQGLTLYPYDLAMLTTAINLLAETHLNDVSLQTYVTAALSKKPNDEGLINIQAQLSERNQNFETAIKFYSKLNVMKPHNLEVNRHLALNYYNAGVQQFNKYGYVNLYNTSGEIELNPKDGKTYIAIDPTALSGDGSSSALIASALNNSNKTQKIKYSSSNRNMAREYFLKAASLLNDVFVSDPLAINYAYALANTYSILGDTKSLDIVNKKILALGQNPVSNNASPSFMAVNNDHVSPVNGINNGYASISTPSYGTTTPKDINTSAVEVPVSSAVPSYSKTVSDVDQDIPSIGRSSNDNTFAVIIANGQYQKTKHVDYAENDGRIFEEYCNKTLGIPKTHIRSHYNVTYGDLLDAVEDIKSIASAKRGNLNIIFYYAGHGIPNESTRTAYILPVDADGKQTRACYPLNELYAELGGIKANNTVVFLDACFSGAPRSGGDMLISARSVAIDVAEDEIDGKVVVFSAASGNQTALGYDEQNHGLFTYFLLKKLKDTKGSADLGSLADYLQENVALESQLKNRKLQTPSVIIGNGYGECSWKNLTLNK